MPKLRMLLSFFCCLLLHACLTPGGWSRFNAKQNNPNINQVTSVVEPQINYNLSKGFRTVASKQIDILHVDLEVSFNWGKHECIGKETLILKPYFYETDSIILDAKNMTFNEIAITDNENHAIQYLTTYDKQHLKIKLERSISPQDSIKLVIKYIAKPDEVEDANGKIKANDKGLYFINTDHSEPTKPMQIWTQGEVEASSCWFPIIDKPNEKFTIKTAITVNKDFTTLSNGSLQSSTIKGVLKTDVWETKKPIPAYLVVMAIAEFKIAKDYLKTSIKDSFVTISYDTIKIPTSDSLAPIRDSLVPIRKINYRNSDKDLLNGVEVSYYLEPDYAPYSLNIFKHTPEMIHFFSSKLGVAYPWEKYSQSVVRDFVAGAMENASATLHNEFVQKNNRQLLDGYNDDIIAHELFHQWFGDLVTCKSWSHLVLNEGFATYGELLWYEYKYGKDAALMESYATLGRYLSYAMHVNDDPIVQFNYKNADDMFSVITYQKGALVLHLLRAELGDAAFFLTLKNYLNEYAYQNADIDDFRNECEKVSGKDLRLFFNQWFLGGGHPSIEIRYDYIDSTKLLGVTVEQKQSKEIGLFSFPLKFKVTQAGQTQYFNFDVEKKIETFFVQKFDTSIVDYPNVFVDPDATFIGEIKDNKPFINHIRSYSNATNYIEKVRSLKALNEIKSTIDTARAVLLTAINDADADIRSKAIEWTNWSDLRNLFPAKYVLISLAKSDSSALIRAKATKALATLKDETLFNLLSELTNDSSYTVAAYALHGVYKLLPEEALRLCLQLEKDARQNLFDQISTIYSNSGTVANASFFENNLLKVSARLRSNLIVDYAQFCIRLNQSNLYVKAIDVLSNRVYHDKNASVRVAALSALNSIYQKQSQDNNLEKDFVKKNENQISISLLKENIQQMLDQEKDEHAINLLKMKGLIPAENENSFMDR